MNNGTEIKYNKEQANYGLEELKKCQKELYEADMLFYKGIMALASARGIDLILREDGGINLYMPEKIVIECREEITGLVEDVTAKIALVESLNNEPKEETSKPEFKKVEQIEEISGDAKPIKIGAGTAVGVVAGHGGEDLHEVINVQPKYGAICPPGGPGGEELMIQPKYGAVCPPGGEELMIQPKYGAVCPPGGEELMIQPKYGAVCPPGDMIVQPDYGVPTPPGDMIVQPDYGVPTPPGDLYAQPAYGVLMPPGGEPVIQPAYGVETPIMQPKYGAICPPPGPVIQPAYGVETPFEPIMQPKYGAICPPPGPVIQPAYGVETPFEPIMQPKYGVMCPPEIVVETPPQVQPVITTPIQPVVTTPPVQPVVTTPELHINDEYAPIPNTGITGLEISSDATPGVIEQNYVSKHPKLIGGVAATMGLFGIPTILSDDLDEEEEKRRKEKKNDLK